MAPVQHADPQTLDVSYDVLTGDLQKLLQIGIFWAASKARNPVPSTWVLTDQDAHIALVTSVARLPLHAPPEKKLSGIVERCARRSSRPLSQTSNAQPAPDRHAEV